MRLGHPTSATLLVVNPSGRTGHRTAARCVAAHSGCSRQPVPAPAHSRRPGAAEHTSSPLYGAATCAPPVSPSAPADRSAWPPGNARLPCRARSARCRRSTLASTCPPGWPACATSTVASAVRVRGQGTEFDSLREYVRGDDVRSIDWRATARNRNVVVRTWQPERDRRVVLVLDTSRTSAGRVDDVPRLDSAMDAALLLAALAARAGDRIDFLAGDRRVRTRLRSSGSRNVAGDSPGRDGRPPARDRRSRLGDLGRRGHGTRAATGTARTADPAGVVGGRGGPAAGPADADQAPPGGARLGRGPRPATAQCGPARSVEDVYDAAAAEQVLARRRGTADLLRTLGVDVVDASAEKLPPALADHYLSLKARGLL